MPARGRAWDAILAEFKADSAAQNAPCWLCRKSIDYELTGRVPNAFSADHVTPTSLGGDPMRRANLRPSHYGCNSRRGNTTRGEFPSSRQW